jgi:hypothetical protein
LQTPLVARLRARVKARAAETGWQRLQARLATGGAVPRSAVLRAFALAIAPLPGVRVSRTGVGRIASGTSALALVLADIRRLTPRQRAVVSRLVRGRPTRRRTARASLAPSAEALRRIAVRIVPYYARALKVRPAFRLDVARAVIGVRPNSDVLSGANAYAYGTDGTDVAYGQRGPVKVCHIRVNILLDYRGADLDQTLAHEVFHCFQMQILGSPAAYGALLARAKWLAEGGAEWAACT